MGRGNGECLKMMEGHRFVSSVAMSRDEGVVSGGGDNSRAHVGRGDGGSVSG